MAAEQAWDVGRAAAGLVDDVAGRVQAVHEAVAARSFRATGILGAPVRVVHDAISGGVYAAVRLGLRGVGGALATAAVLNSDAPEDLGRTRRGNLGLSILNGFLGDQLPDEAPTLEIAMAVRRERTDVPLTAKGLREAFPDAGRRVAVFVHGLCENEESWYVRAERHHGVPAMCLADRLGRDHGLTGVHLRYNTGRHISDNGRDLDRLLETLLDAWPEPVEQLVLVGHSMGGLVIRSAEHAAAESGRGWRDQLTHVICLGTPHRGAPLEKAVHVGSWLLARVPESRPFAGFLDRRSAGIKDLRFGYLREEDWAAGDAHALWQDGSEDVPFTDGVTYHVVCATLGEEGSLVGSALGDLLVRLPSSSGRVRRGRPIHFHGVDHLPKADHFDLLNHAEVHDKVSAALAASGP